MNNTKPYDGLMIITDLDGTFVTPEYEVPKANVQAVDHFVEGGGVFSIATGRSVEAARQYVVKSKIKHPVITTNGAVIYDYKNEKIISQNPLDRACAMEYAQLIMDNFPQVGVEIHCGRELYIFHENEQVLKHLDNECIIPERPDSLEDTPQIWHKILVGGKTEDLNKVDEFCKKYCADKVQYVFTSPYYYEMISIGVSKGEALKSLSKHLNIPISHVIAMGDYYNDVEMLSAAGISAISGNSPDDMKQYADYVLCDCHDGVAADVLNILDNGLAQKLKAL